MHVCASAVTPPMLAALLPTTAPGFACACAQSCATDAVPCFGCSVGRGACGACAAAAAASAAAAGGGRAGGVGAGREAVAAAGREGQGGPCHAEPRRAHHAGCAHGCGCCRPGRACCGWRGAAEQVEEGGEWAPNAGARGGATHAMRAAAPAAAHRQQASSVCGRHSGLCCVASRVQAGARTHAGDHHAPTRTRKHDIGCQHHRNYALSPPTLRAPGRRHARRALGGHAAREPGERACGHGWAAGWWRCWLRAGSGDEEGPAHARRPHAGERVRGGVRGQRVTTRFARASRSPAMLDISLFREGGCCWHCWPARPQHAARCAHRHARTHPRTAGCRQGRGLAGRACVPGTALCRRGAGRPRGAAGCAVPPRQGLARARRSLAGCFLAMRLLVVLLPAVRQHVRMQMHAATHTQARMHTRTHAHRSQRRAPAAQHAVQRPEQGDCGAAEGARVRCMRACVALRR